MALRKRSSARHTKDSATERTRALPGYRHRPRTIRVPKRVVIKQPEPPKRRPWKRIVTWALAIVVSVCLIAGGWVAVKFITNEVRLFGWSGLLGLLWPEKLQGEDAGHINILLAGNSADDAGHGGAQLTDSIMIVSINPGTNTAFMLSVPRDLYVDIPGYGYAKINEAYQIGEQEHFAQQGYASGGMGQLEQVVSNTFGITLNYYALVDYATVRDAVNAVGGIDVTVKSADPRGLYDPNIDYANHNQPLVDLSNGTHHLTGPEALALARARGNSYGSYGYEMSDFQRTANQQQIIIGLKDRATSAGTLTNPLKLGQLFDSVGGNLSTDLSLGNVRRLYGFTQKIPAGSIVTGTLNTATGEDDLVTDYTTDAGQSALVPSRGTDDYTDIQAYVARLLSQ